MGLTVILICLALGAVVLNIVFRKKMITHFRALESHGIPIRLSGIWKRDIRESIADLYPDHRSLILSAYADMRQFIVLASLIIFAIFGVGVLMYILSSH